MTNTRRAPASSPRRRAPAAASPGVSGGGQDDGDGSSPPDAPMDEAEIEQEALESASSGASRAGLIDVDVEVEVDDGKQLAPRSPDPRPLPASPATYPRDPVGRFIAEIRRYPRLSEDDERELGRAVRERGDMDAARRLVVHNMRLVVAIAHQYRRAWANILDLFQEGSVGLMEAVKRWEPTLGPRFGSYAAYWIRAYVLKFLMTNSRLIHVGNTRAGRKLFFRLERERQKLIASGFEPTPKLLAAKLDVNEQDLAEVGRHLDSREISFDPMASGGDGETRYSLSERLPIEQASPEDRAASAEMSGALHQVMDEFSASLADDRERAVWREHLAATEPVSLGEIGSRFGVSKQRMGQIADKLKTRFREQIVARLGPEIRTDWLGGDD